MLHEPKELEEIMSYNTDIPLSLTINMRGQSYPVLKKGRGIPCLAIGTGILTQRSLSSTFHQHFEVYASDLYFAKDHAFADSSHVTMDVLVEDIKAWGEALGLDHYVIFGHSAFGILGLEFVKKYPDLVSALLITGTPVNSNPLVGAQNNAIFENQAEDRRKQIDKTRRAQVAKEDLNRLAPSERFLREYVYRDAARYWHIPDYDCSHLWEGIILDQLIERLFAEIFPSVDVTQNLEFIQTPIFLAAGVSDYDCCPWLWRDLPNLPKNMIIKTFTHSGHWPQYEEPLLFDTRVIEWMKTIIKKKA